MNSIFYVLRIACVAIILLIPCFVATADEITLGIHPYKSAITLKRAYNPLAKYLSHALRKHVRITVSKNYQQHIKDIGEDKLDIAYMGPVSYLKLVEGYGSKPILARLEINGNPTFQGHIFSRNDGPIKKITDIKGRRFAFGSAASTMSHLVPRYMLWKSGVMVNNMARFDFLGNHDNVALAVLSGKYDAGAVKEAVFYKYKSRGLRSIAITPKLSEHIFVASKGMQRNLLQRLRTAMLNLHKHPNGTTILHAIKKTITRLVPAQTTDYDNLRKILADLATIGVK